MKRIIPIACIWLGLAGRAAAGQAPQGPAPDGPEVARGDFGGEIDDFEGARGDRRGEAPAPAPAGS